jgi:hypothetical protein
MEDNAFSLDIRGGEKAITMELRRKVTRKGEPEWIKYELAGFICPGREDVKRLVEFLNHELKYVLSDDES